MDWCAALMIRNEERMISETIECIRAQTIPPARILVFDDGSVDKTGEIVDAMEDVEVLHIRRHSSDLSSDNYDKKRSNLVKNACRDVDYAVYVDGDTSLSSRYVEDITKEMKSANCVLACGIDPSEPQLVPPESGLVIDARWHVIHSPPFPASIMCAWANADGYAVATFRQIFLQYRRKTGTNYTPASVTHLGGQMKRSGVYFPHVVWKAARMRSFYIIKGYLAYAGEQYPEHVLDWHKMLFRERIKEKFGFSKRLCRTTKAFYILPNNAL